MLRLVIPPQVAPRAAHDRQDTTSLGRVPWPAGSWFSQGTRNNGNGFCGKRMLRPPNGLPFQPEQPRLVVDAHNGSQPGVAVEIICPRSQNRGYRCLSRLAAVMASSSQSDGAQQADAGNFSPLGPPSSAACPSMWERGTRGIFFEEWAERRVDQSLGAPETKRQS